MRTRLVFLTCFFLLLSACGKQQNTQRSSLDDDRPGTRIARLLYDQACFMNGMALHTIAGLHLKRPMTADSPSMRRLVRGKFAPINIPARDELLNGEVSSPTNFAIRHYVKCTNRYNNHYTVRQVAGCYRFTSVLRNAYFARSSGISKQKVIDWYRSKIRQDASESFHRTVRLMINQVYHARSDRQALLRIYRTFAWCRSRRIYK